MSQGALMLVLCYRLVLPLSYAVIASPVGVSVYTMYIHLNHYRVRAELILCVLALSLSLSDSAIAALMSLLSYMLLLRAAEMSA